MTALWSCRPELRPVWERGFAVAYEIATDYAQTARLGATNLSLCEEGHGIRSAQEAFELGLRAGWIAATTDAVFARLRPVWHWDCRWSDTPASRAARRTLVRAVQDQARAEGAP